MSNLIPSLIGGAYIGLAVSIMYLFNGRITGISGILNGTLHPQKKDFAWRLFFIAGLCMGGIIMNALHPELFIQISRATTVDYIMGGMLVGFGTVMGSGCTSGHGICGISRMSSRSILATLIFIFFGILSCALFKYLHGEL